MARKKKADDGGEGANWMDTYGDLVTLLLTFFVLLFSFSSMDAAKWEGLVNAFSGRVVSAITVLSPETAMQNPIEMIARSPTDEETEATSQEPVAERLAIMSELEVKLNAFMMENGLSEGVDITTQAKDMTVTVRFNDSILFDSGRAEIRADGYPVIDLLLDGFVENLHLIAKIGIEGHTDNTPIHNGLYRDNMELSLMRAYSVYTYMADTEKLDPSLYKLAAFGEYVSIQPNDTEEHKQQNRRVTFVLETVMKIEGLSTTEE